MTGPPGALCELLGIRYPIIQDGLGPYGTAALAAAVSSAGGLGTVSIPGLSVDAATGSRRLRSHLDATAAQTERPFAVNVPVGVDRSGAVLPISDAYIGTAISARRADAAMAGRLVACITSAGFSDALARRIRDAGMVHLHKVGALRHARRAAAAGAQVVIASGSEMGGHTHETPFVNHRLDGTVWRPRSVAPPTLPGTGGGWRHGPPRRSEHPS